MYKIILRISRTPGTRYDSARNRGAAHATLRPIISTLCTFSKERRGVHRGIKTVPTAVSAVDPLIFHLRSTHTAASLSLPTAPFTVVRME